MHDAKKIVPGIIIFLLIVSFPVWYSIARGSADYVPEPEIITQEERCVEDAEYMRENHADILEEWRETVVREGIRTYVTSDGREFDMSLTRTCLECHSNKAQFCDRCHDYAAVKPVCWDCHVVPEGE